MEANFGGTNHLGDTQPGLQIHQPRSPLDVDHQTLCSTAPFRSVKADEGRVARRTITAPNYSRSRSREAERQASMWPIRVLRVFWCNTTQTTQIDSICHRNPADRVLAGIPLDPIFRPGKRQLETQTEKGTSLTFRAIGPGAATTPPCDTQRQSLFDRACQAIRLPLLISPSLKEEQNDVE